MEEERTEEMTHEISEETNSEDAREIESLRETLIKLRTESDVNAAMLEAGVKNAAAVRGVLEDYVSKNISEDGSVPGLSDRLAELAGDAETAFLFRDSSLKYLGSSPGEAGIDPQLADEEMGYEAELRSARESGNFLKAIRLKQEAAKEGIILI